MSTGIDPNEIKNKYIIAINTNVGSLGQNDNLSDNNRATRRRLADLVTEVRSKYASDDVVLCIQECGTYECELPPHFKGPISTDEQVSFGRKVGGKRGVATYATSRFTHAFPASDEKHEICAVVSYFKNSKGGVSKALIVNVYRNISKDYKRSVNDTITAIRSLIKKAANEGVGQVIIVGDFNATNIQIDLGTFELLHKAWFHRANDSTETKYNDKAFTNMPNCGFLEIKPSCENVGSEDLGHKCAVLFLGKKPNESQSVTQELISVKK